MHKNARLPAGLSRQPDGKWRLRATATCPRTGKQKEMIRTLPQDASKDEALLQFVNLKQQLKERLEGKEEAKSAKRLCVTDYAEQWLKRRAMRVRPSVAKHYTDKLALFILPKLGDLRLDALTREDIERWVLYAERATMKGGAPYARETVAGWWRVLTMMVRDAVAELNLPIDPTNRVRPPKPKAGHRREMRTLTVAEVGKLLSSVKKVAPDRYGEVFVLAFTGMRAGELFALKWEDIDEERGRILVRRSVWNGHEDATKTDDPREVALTCEMAEVLREHRQALIRRQHRGLRTGLVFPAGNGNHRFCQSLHKPLTFATTMAGITVKVTPQVLRRTFNTLLLLSGIDRIVIRSQMGHTSEEMTARYAGVPLGSKQDALKALLQLVSTTEATTAL